jgi:signal transduction histidine kinase
VPGVGLGLVITKVIVEAHERSLDFEGRVAEGTTFRIELPLRPGGAG